MNKVPKFLKKYFWDIDFARLDIKTHPRYVLGRILEYGDKKTISWMRKNFTEEEVADILLHFRSLSPKSANFWAVIFGIDRKKVLCLQKLYLEKQRIHWPY